MEVIPQVYRAAPGEVPAAESPGYCPSCGGPCGLRPAGGRTRAVCTRCGRVRYRNPSPGVAVVVHDTDRVLLVRRRAERPGDDVDAVRWAPLRGPHLDLAFDGDRVALAALAEGRLPLLPIDPRFRRWPRCG